MSELQEAYAKLERIAKKYTANNVQKSMTSQTPQSAKVANAVAIAKATAANPKLTRRILQLEQREAVRKMFAPVRKYYEEDEEEDDWTRMFSEV